MVFLLLTLNIFYTFSSDSVVDFKQVNACSDSLYIPLFSPYTVKR